MKVLLVADIGTSESGFYHVGDEAMFYETYRWYTKHSSSTKIGALSRSISHTHLDIEESLHLPLAFSNNKARRYYLLLMLKRIFLRCFKMDMFSDEERTFVKYVESFDVIHFSGGGNFYSHFVPWLYYVFFIIFLGRFSKKRVILLSQTIGPFNFIDQLFAMIFLNMTDIVALRQPIRKRYRDLPGVIIPQVYGMVDVAYTLPLSTKLHLPKTKNIRIGLSLHEWGDYKKLLSDVIQRLFKELSSKGYSIELVLIPHILVHDHSGWDMVYMKDCIVGLPKKFKVIEFSYTEIMKSTDEPSQTIKYLTSQVDLLLSSRYHGVVFALSENIPVIACSMGQYYGLKNSKALEFLYEENADRYLVDLDDPKADSKLMQKAEYILDNNEKEKKLLKENNRRLKRDSRWLYLDILLRTTV